MRLLTKVRQTLNFGTLEEWKRKEFVYIYQKAFFYITATKTELLKPLGFWNETLLLLTWVAISFEVKPTLIQVLVGYVGFMVVLLIVGKLLAAFNFFQHSASITNKFNPEMQEILHRLERIEKHIIQSKDSPTSLK